MTRQRWTPVLGIVVIIAILVTGCGAATGVPAPSPLNPSTGGSRDVASPPFAPAATPAPAAGQGGGSTAVGDQMIIKTGTMGMLVKDVQETLATITAMAVKVDGYVVSTRTSREGEKTVGTISIKVPAGSFESTMDSLRKLAVEPPTESSSGQDVTEEYSDLEAQLRNLQATEKQLLNLLDRAQTVDDTLKVYNQLTNIRGQIERLQGRMQFLQKSSAMSTITVTLRPVEDKPIVKTGTEAWQPGETLKEAARTLVSVAQVLGDLAIWAVVFSPVCIVPIVFLWIIWRLTRRRAKGAIASDVKNAAETKPR